MSKRTIDPPLALGRKLLLPCLGAAALAHVLRSIYPPTAVDTVLFDPAIIAGASLASLLLYISFRLLGQGTRQRPVGHLFGLANTVTLLRGALYAVVAGCVILPPATSLAWVPALAYGSGAMLDKVDGTVARTIGQQTALGERLDMTIDTFGFVAAPVVAVAWGLLPGWYLSLSAARYVYRGGCAWRRHRGAPIYDPPASDLGKYLAGIQMAFLTIVLIPPVPTGATWTAAPVVLAPSLAVFARDYLTVTGRLSQAED
jgi:CDP-diacylglycerol--glycerol-3-phosphate 3-phosphatidyltransferase